MIKLILILSIFASCKELVVEKQTVFRTKCSMINPYEEANYTFCQHGEDGDPVDCVEGVFEHKVEVDCQEFVKRRN